MSRLKRLPVVVLDTNILFEGLASSRGASHLLLRLLEAGRLLVPVSPDMAAASVTVTDRCGMAYSRCCGRGTRRKAGAR